MTIEETLDTEDPLLARLTQLALTHEIDPVAHRELRSLLRDAAVAKAVGRQQPEVGPDRYERMGLLGKGAIGEVIRVRDPNLGRVVALKALRPRAAFEAQQIDRFVAEAQTLAQLQHPSILPVYELGRLTDGRAYFTMPEIRGTTLSQRILSTMASSTGPGTGTVGRRRLVDILAQAAEAVAYAHERGVIHRDLKPDNIMVGDFGEVYVLDWGLAKVVGRDDPMADPEDTILTDRRTEDVFATTDNQVLGTPMYMSPEQARPGARLTAASDVFSLGAILLEILTGERPRQGRSVGVVIRQALSNQLHPLPENTPPTLADIVRKATATQHADRYRSAKPFSEDLRRWLDGEAQRDSARRAVQDAGGLLPGIEQLNRRARGLFDEASLVLDNLPPHAPIEAKRPAWKLQDQARELQRRATAWETEYTQALFDAVNLAPDLEEAHQRLAEHYRRRHEAAELADDEHTAQHALARLRAHHHGRYQRYLEGKASLELPTARAGIPVRLAPIVEVDRRWVLGEARDLGETPLDEVEVSHGRFALLLDRDGGEPWRIPVRIGREQHWTPSDRQGGPTPLALPDPGSVGPEDHLVPAGPCTLGGDDRAWRGRRASTVYVEPFIARRHPVTNAEWLQFLEELIGEGRAAQAQEFTPKALAGEAYTWQPRWPVRGVTPAAAEAFAAWTARQTGQPWRLPTEVEWEKLARGVDGRAFPFGNHLDPAWCRMRDSRPEGPAPVDAHPEDESPYGIRGLGGNVRDWCADVHGSFRVARGGAFDDHPDACRAASRHLLLARDGDPRVGLRLVRSC